MKKINNKINCCCGRDNYDNNHNHNHNHNNKGFSLIELSIVLIIMGLLVAGITGGAALIKSAQLRTLMTEFQNYRVAYNTYYGLYDRVPGTNGGAANVVSASYNAWYDLKSEGIIEKSPDSNGYISSKYKNAYWRIQHTESYELEITDLLNLNLLILTGKDETGTAGVLGVRETRSLLEKLDDGAPNTGLIRACQGGDGDGNSLEGCVLATSLPDNSTSLYILLSKLDF